MSKKLLVLIPLLVIASIALVSCQQAQSYECEDALGCVTYAADEPIRIASALVISGPNTDLGTDSQYGVEIAIDMRGRVAGHDVELQAEDDGCSAEGGLAGTFNEMIVLNGLEDKVEDQLPLMDKMGVPVESIGASTGPLPLEPLGGL